MTDKSPRDEMYEAIATAVYVCVLLLIVCGIPLVVLTWRTL